MVHFQSHVDNQITKYFLHNVTVFVYMHTWVGSSLICIQVALVGLITVLDDIAKLVNAQAEEIAKIEQDTEQISLNVNWVKVRNKTLSMVAST